MTKVFIEKEGENEKDDRQIKTQQLSISSKWFPMKVQVKVSYKKLLQNEGFLRILYVKNNNNLKW